MVKVKRKERKLTLNSTQRYTDRKTGKFKKGNPGRPLGAVSQTTLLKEKLLKAALEIDLHATRTIHIHSPKTGKIVKTIEIRDIPRKDIMKTAATFVPRETKVDVNSNMPLAVQVVHNYKPTGDTSKGRSSLSNEDGA